MEKSIKANFIERKGGVDMKRIKLTMSVVLVILCMALASQAEETAPAKTYSGDIWSRSTLTGDWGGLRNDWAKKGVTFDMSLTQTGMSVVSGGNNQGWEYAGRGDLTIHMDTQKMGLWPGGFFTVEVEGNYNESINLDPGAIMPVNFNQLFPTAGSQEVNIPEVSFMQFFSQFAGVFIGKLDTTSGDANEFAHGKGDRQFFNMAFNINPVLGQLPVSALGAGIIIVPTGDPKAAIINFSVIDGDGKANTSGFDTVFKGNTVYGAEVRGRTNFFNMTGHQLLGGVYNTKSFSSLDQSSRFIIRNRGIEQKDNAWLLYYNFDQYLYEPQKGSGKGLGIFGRLGLSDGNPNPMNGFFSVGIGGKGIVPGRPLDEFGIGYYYIDVTNPTFTGPIETREALRNEYGGEAYYNFAVTPWMKLTPDIQVIRGAQKQTVSVESLLPPVIKRQEVDTAVVVGLRLQVIF